MRFKNVHNENNNNIVYKNGQRNVYANQSQVFRHEKSNGGNGSRKCTSNFNNNVQKPCRQNILIPGDVDIADNEVEDDPEAGVSSSLNHNTEKIHPDKVKIPQESSLNTSKLQVCPNKKHEIKKKGDSCPCLLLQAYEVKSQQLVLSEWHARNVNVLPLKSFKLSRNKVFQGGQGVVYTVTCQLNSFQSMSNVSNSQDEFVMKIKDRRPNQKTRSWKRDLREVFLMKELRHPFIIELKHAFLTDTFYSLVMEHGSRGSLWGLICKKGCLPTHIAAYYVACMLSALQHVHKHNFIFRDMKAENVVIMDDYRPKLIDFGMAKAFNKPSVRNTFTNFYFAAYIAPEVYAEPKTVTEKVDCWGVGYLTLELTVGLGVFKSLPWATSKHTQPDWKFEMPKKMAIKTNRDSLRFVEKCLERNPEKRPCLEKMKDFAFLRNIDFRLLLASKPPDMTLYLDNTHAGDKKG